MTQTAASLSPRLLLRVEEAAEALALSRTAVYGLLRAGEIPAIHIGRSVRIPFRALEQYIEDQMKQRPDQ